MKHILTIYSHHLTDLEIINNISSTFYNNTGYEIAIIYRSYKGVLTHIEISSDVCSPHNPFNKFPFINKDFTIQSKTICIYFCPIEGINLKYSLIPKN
jgi:hypothetical protein